MPNTYSSLLRTVLKIFLVIGVVYAMYHSKAFILPVLVAALLAMLVNPVDNWLMDKGFPHWAAMTVSMLIIISIFAGLFIAVGHQTASFADNWPEIQENFASQIHTIRVEWGLQGIIPDLRIPDDSDKGMLDKLPVNNSTIMGFVSAALGIVGDFLLMLIYIVLMLSQKERIRQFILRRMPDEERGETHYALNESLDVAQKYLRGRMILIAILSVLYGIGFTVSGVSYGILLAVLAAVTSLIPWIGNFFGLLIVLAVSFANGDGSTALYGIIISVSVAQMLESYVLTPLIVGDEVNLNPLTVVLGVLGLNFVWGPIGALIGIPILAVLRVIFSHVDALDDYAFLLGTEKVK